MPAPASNQTQSAKREPRANKPQNSKAQKQESTSDQAMNPTTPSKNSKKRRTRNQPQAIKPEGQLLESPSTPTRPLMSQPNHNKNAMQDIKSPSFVPNNATTPARNIQSPRTNQAPVSMTPLSVSKPQAYAGPTFHNSPAPSALPIPKFFAKSLPPRDKETGLKKMMHDESESLSANEESPTLANSLRVGGAPQREVSPLDIFFQADREQKAKRQAETGSALNTPDYNRSRTVSPMPEYMRGPDRNQPSPDGVFPLPMEMDGQQQTNPPPHPHPDHLRAASSPSIVMMNQAAQNDMQRKAKTQALKQLLLSPQPSRAQSATPRSGVSAHQLESPFMTPNSRPNNFYRSVSGSSTPAHSDNGRQYGGPPNSSSSHAFSPNVYPSPISMGPRSTQPRPLSSHLRQELLHDSTNELPASPTPARTVHNLYKTTSNSQDRPIEQKRPTGTFTPEDALKVLGNGDKNLGNTRNTTGMEDELRRILKLDLLTPSTKV